MSSIKESNDAYVKTCDRYLSMTSTLEGLRALVSEDSYKHSIDGELEISASRGCPVCYILRFGSLVSAGRSGSVVSAGDNAAITTYAADPMDDFKRTGSISPSTRRYPLEATILTKLYINKTVMRSPISVFTTQLQGSWMSSLCQSQLRVPQLYENK
jgi:hypothetical protein